MAEGRLNLGVGVLGDDRPRQKFSKPATKAEMVKWVENQGYDPDIEQALLAKLAKYPMHTFYRFRQNIDRYMQEIRRQRNERHNAEALLQSGQIDNPVTTLEHEPDRDQEKEG